MPRQGETCCQSCVELRLVGYWLARSPREAGLAASLEVWRGAGPPCSDIILKVRSTVILVRLVYDRVNDQKGICTNV